MKLHEIEEGKRFRIPTLFTEEKKMFKGKVNRQGEGAVLVTYDHLPYTPLTISLMTEVERDDEN